MRTCQRKVCRTTLLSARDSQACQQYARKETGKADLLLPFAAWMFFANVNVALRVQMFPLMRTLLVD